MKKIVNKLKQNAKIIAAFVLGAILTGGTVYAATVLPSSQVGYDNSTSGLAATDVQGALDELYQKTRNLYPMQGFDKSILSTTGASAKVYDKRDGNIYTVKKLKDGNIWMTENLRIVNKTITPADSNVTSNYTIPESDISAFTTDYNTNAAYVDSLYGGYYNFYTATAGTGGTSLTSGNAPSDICPKGWRLPTGGTSGEFQTLKNKYSPDFVPMLDNLGFTLSGRVVTGSVGDQGSKGYFWVSSVVSNNIASGFYLESSDVSNSAGQKYFGYSVRCVAK